jgi:hypothetical protein
LSGLRCWGVRIEPFLTEIGPIFDLLRRAMF